jgi:lysophospholipase L1-like esterase
MRKASVIGLCAALFACGGTTGGGIDSGTDAGTDAGTHSSFDGGPVEAMPRISGGAPAYAANGSSANAATAAAQNNVASQYESSGVPMSVAVDLSATPVAQRQQVLIAWYAKTQDFIIDLDCAITCAANAGGTAFTEIPIDYTLESNPAAGGGAPPASGWVNLTTVTGNNRSSRQFVGNLNGANWVRISVSRGIKPTAVGISIDVHSAPAGATDDWLFMGDSNTAFTMPRFASDLPYLVNALKPTHFPAVIGAGIGGTNTVTAQDIIDSNLSFFPGRFVVLAYGTNDGAANYQMETLVQRVIAAGKTPVVPHILWSATTQIQAIGPSINAQIDALYAKYPAILPGPDLWGHFQGHTEWVPADNIHVNTDGQEELRKQWASVMASIDL